jgi:hypothetical protein
MITSSWTTRVLTSSDCTPAKAANHAGNKDRKKVNAIVVIVTPPSVIADSALNNE